MESWIMNELAEPNKLDKAVMYRISSLNSRGYYKIIQKKCAAFN